jgi:hypothetical protein
MGFQIGFPALRSRPRSPRAPWGDSANVSLLLHCEGADNSTTFTDSSLNAFSATRTGNCVISTSEFQYGSASLFMDGSDALNWTYNSALDFATTDFTIAAWVRYDTGGTASDRRIFALGGGAVAWNATNGLHILLQARTTTRFLILELSENTSSPIVASSTLSLPLSQFCFVTACVSGNSVYLGVDGTVQSFSIPARARPSANPTARLGWVPGETNTNTPWLGRFDEVLVVKNEALYTSNFTPPDGPFFDP